MYLRVTRILTLRWTLFGPGGIWEKVEVSAGKTWGKVSESSGISWEKIAESGGILWDKIGEPSGISWGKQRYEQKYYTVSNLYGQHKYGTMKFGTKNLVPETNWKKIN